MLKFQPPLWTRNCCKLFEKWHTSFKRKVMREAESLTTTPVLQSLLRSARNQNNDEDHPECDDMASFLLLLHILPPQPTKKKTQKIGAAQAMDHIVVFHKSCRSLEEHLENQRAHRQPYLLASGTGKQAISTYYVVIDKRLIPCKGTTSLAAFDELFNVHFVVSVSYDDALNNMYTFLQTKVYSINVDTTKESPKVNELRAKFLEQCIYATYVSHCAMHLVQLFQHFFCIGYILAKSFIFLNLQCLFLHIKQRLI